MPPSPKRKKPAPRRDPLEMIRRATAATHLPTAAGFVPAGDGRTGAFFVFCGCGEVFTEPDEGTTTAALLSLSDRIRAHKETRG